MRYFPAFLDLHGAPVLLVGAGVVAARKLALLTAAGARVTVVAPAAVDAVRELASAGTVAWLSRRFEAGDVLGQRLVIAATGDREVNAAVAASAKAQGLWVNVVDDPALASFIVPSIVDRSPVQVAISTGGTAPVLARLLRERLEALLPEWLGTLALVGERWRTRLRSRWPAAEQRRRFLERLYRAPRVDALWPGREAVADRWVERELARADDVAEGYVTLVGAGPGDPGLLTLNALRALQAADVILHDQLVTPEILALARRDATLQSVGKQAGGHRTEQARIHQQMIELARQGLHVVRLKGGDPFIFGRGGEEIEALRLAGIRYEIVPGITAAIGCAAYAGIPLTHRDHAQSVTFLTAHCRESLDTNDWHALARGGRTLVAYMGLRLLPQLEQRLVAGGLDPATPAALIERGTRQDQRVLVATLGTLAERASEAGVQSPALLVIGEVAAHATTQAWFGAAPQVAAQSPVIDRLDAVA